MKRRFAEETILLISVIKWVFLASIIGAIVGLSSTLFLRLLNWGIDLNKSNLYFLILPVALFLNAFFIYKLFPSHNAYDTGKIIECIHKRKKIFLPSIIKGFFSPVLTIVSGGSAGKEAPCADVGAGIASFLSDIVKLNDEDRRKLMICGVAAGFASVFGTPIAGAMFGVEVLFIGSILYDVLLPSFVAGIISYHVSSTLGITYFYSPLNFIPVFSEGFFIKVVIAGIFFGICSVLLIETLRLGNVISGKLRISKPLKGIIGGFALIGLVFIFSKEYLGLGLDTIQSCLQGTKTVWYAFLLKMVFTGITLSFGGSGGIVTPIFFIGASSGTLFASLLGLDIATFSAIGLVALLAGAANTPIAASIMAVELFGPKVAPYATVACVISFLMTGHRSVYPSQVLSSKKSPSFSVETGAEIEKVEARFHPRSKSLIGILFAIVKTIKGKIKK